MGKVFVQEVILNVPDQAEDPFKSLIPSPKACSAFLNDNDLVVTATDKNLGIAVSKQTWLNEKWLDLLLDKNNLFSLPLPVDVHLNLSSCVHYEYSSM